MSALPIGATWVTEVCFHREILDIADFELSRTSRKAARNPYTLVSFDMRMSMIDTYLGSVFPEE